MYLYKGNEPNYPYTLHHSPWPFSCPCLPLFWSKMGTQLVLDHKNNLYTAFVIASGSLFIKMMVKWNSWHILKSSSSVCTLPRILRDICTPSRRIETFEI